MFKLPQILTSAGSMLIAVSTLASSAAVAAEFSMHPQGAMDPGIAREFHGAFGRSSDPAGLASLHPVREDDTLVASSLIAQGLAGQMEVGLAIGGQFGNTATVDTGGAEVDFDADAGFMTKVNLDYFINDRVAIGGYVSTFFTWTEPGGDLSHFSIGPAVKARYAVGQDSGSPIFITPGLSVGFASFTDDNDTYTGSLITLSVDVRKRMSSGMDLFLETGLLTGPTGGNSDVDITFGPTLYILVGAGWIVN